MSSWKSWGRWEERDSLSVTEPWSSSSARSRTYQSSMTCWVCSSRTVATLLTTGENGETGSCVKWSLMITPNCSQLATKVSWGPWRVQSRLPYSRLSHRAPSLVCSKVHKSVHNPDRIHRSCACGPPPLGGRGIASEGGRYGSGIMQPGRARLPIVLELDV